MWQDGFHRCNLVLATVKGAKESWAVITDETPSLQTLWQYALRFRVEELFLDSKSGAFELEDSRLRCLGCTQTLVFGCSYCHSLCDNPRYGSTNRRVAATSRPALATGYQLSQDWLTLAWGGSPQRTSVACSRSTAPQRSSTLCMHPSGLSKISMTRFGFPVSAP